MFKPRPLVFGSGQTDAHAFPLRENTRPDAALRERAMQRLRAWIGGPCEEWRRLHIKTLRAQQCRESFAFRGEARVHVALPRGIRKCGRYRVTRGSAYGPCAERVAQRFQQR